MTTSQDWWPADYGHYGPLFIRMAWHSAGTYRIADGRGGAGAGILRFAPLNSWPDNVNLDKARRLLWPIKQKYGRKLSWADLMVFTGNCALESMGFKTLRIRRRARGTSVGAREDVYWGRRVNGWETSVTGATGNLKIPLGAVQMGLDLRESGGAQRQPGSGRRREGHSGDLRPHGHERRGDRRADRRRTHIRQSPRRCRCEQVCRSANRRVPRLEEQGLGWKNSFGSGNGGRTRSPAAWRAPGPPTPTKWDNNYFDNLFGYEWEQATSPAGHTQWTPKDPSAVGTVPDAHDPSKKHAPMMFTTDLSLRMDPIYSPISKRFHENPDELADAFARAWFKLTHRDMGPVSRYLGPLVPANQELWQDPVPDVDHELIDEQDIADLKVKMLASGLSISQLVSTAWASAATFRGTDKRGGANGARIRLAPQKDWEVNQPAELAKVLQTLEKVQQEFNSSQSGGKQVSLADLIVLGGMCRVEAAAKKAGQAVQCPSRRAARTRRRSRPTSTRSPCSNRPRTVSQLRRETAMTDQAEELLVDRAHLLTLTAPEMTVLVGGMRALNANVGQSELGVFTNRPEMLTNDFFVNLLDMNTKWQASSTSDDVFEGAIVRRAGQVDRIPRRPRLRFELPAAPSRKSMPVTTRSGVCP